MAEANVNVAENFKIGVEEMTVFLLNQTFNRGVFWMWRDFLYCFVQRITTGQICYIENMQDLIWSC